MTTPTPPLSEALRRIADAAPEIPVPADTWERARAARRRDRALAGGSAVAAAAAVVAVAVLVSGTDRPAEVAASPTLPRVVEAVSPVPISGLRAGTAAAAYPAAQQTVVLVGGPGEPGYRAISLPDRTGPVALSPDGTRLAYAWVDPLRQTSRGTDVTGLGVVDLTTGEEDRARIAEQRRSVQVADLVWDGDSRTLGYLGVVVLDDSPSGSTLGGLTAGLLREGARLAPHVTVPDGTSELALGVGDVGWTVSDTLVRVQERAGNPPGRQGVVASAVPDTTAPLVGTCATGSVFTTVRRDPDGRFSAQGYVLDGDRIEETAGALPAALDGRDVEVLGCSFPGAHTTLTLDGTRVAVRTGADLGVAVLGERASYDVVARVDDAVQGLSVAADLVG